MINISRRTREEMDARWEAYRQLQASVRPVAREVPPRPQNVHAILDLGNLVYFEFRGRPYGVPPLPWREGEQLMDLWLEVRGYGSEITGAKVQPYFAAMRKLARLIWRNSRPCGFALRAAKRLHLLRNPFMSEANERELADIAVFFLGLRTKSTGSFRPGPDARVIS
jgi:hypothetical protein